MYISSRISKQVKQNNNNYNNFPPPQFKNIHLVWFFNAQWCLLAAYFAWRSFWYMELRFGIWLVRTVSTAMTVALADVEKNSPIMHLEPLPVNTELEWF